jgi:hypothetical protein
MLSPRWVVNDLNFIVRISEVLVISNVILRLEKRPILHFLLGVALLLMAVVIIGCSGNVSTMVGPSMGTVQVSISDPPSCMPPNGNFMHLTTPPDGRNSRRS